MFTRELLQKEINWFRRSGSNSHTRQSRFEQALVHIMKNYPARLRHEDFQPWATGTISRID
jgi:hypothetical protein